MVPTDKIEQLNRAVKRCEIAQFRPKAHQHQVDPISGREIILNVARSQRHFETKQGAGKKEITAVDECMYCNFQTTPTLFYIDEGQQAVFPPLDAVIEEVRKYLNDDGKDRGAVKTYYDLVKEIADSNRIESAWLCRVFLNLTPSIVPEDRSAAGNCFLVCGSKSCHYNDLWELPTANLAAIIQTWQVLAAWSESKGLTFIPFCNAGKSLASGQSVDCFHFQAYAQTEVPPLYQQMKEKWDNRECPVCATLQENYLVMRRGSFGIYVHPYPEHDFTWIVAEESCQSKGGFQQVDRQNLAKALKAAAGLYPLVFGEIPAYNVLVRLAEHVGHFHALFVPRTNTNVLAGYEYTTGMTVLTQDPRQVAEFVREKISE